MQRNEDYEIKEKIDETCASSSTEQQAHGLTDFGGDTFVDRLQQLDPEERIPIWKRNVDKNRVKVKMENEFPPEVSSVQSSSYTQYEDIIVKTEDRLQLINNQIEPIDKDDVIENVVVVQENPIYVTKTYKSDQHGPAIFDQMLTGNTDPGKNNGDSNERTEDNIIMEQPMDLSFKRKLEMSEEQRHTYINDNTQAKRCSNDQSSKITAVRSLRDHDIDYNSEHKSNKSQRIESLSSDKQFACSFCNYKSNRKSRLMEHIRLHTGEKPFSCNMCDKNFNIRSNLVKHIRVHTGEKPLICTACNKKFNDQSNLLTHIRVHTGEKPFICTACNKKFNLKSDLLTHIRVHTGEKPFGCTTCDKKFKHKKTLINHIRVHTGEKPFACNMCE